MDQVPLHFAYTVSAWDGGIINQCNGSLNKEIWIRNSKEQSLTESTAYTLDTFANEFLKKARAGSYLNLAHVKRF